MNRYYRFIEPNEQSEVLAVMGWLTAAALLADTRGNPLP